MQRKGLTGAAAEEVPGKFAASVDCFLAVFKPALDAAVHQVSLAGFRGMSHR